jgi:hypothetical protein
MPITATKFMRTLGLEPDPWQTEVLESTCPRLLLNCCRQGGKTTVVSLHALYHAVYEPGTKVVIVAPSFRQSSELFRTVADYFDRFGKGLHQIKNKSELTLNNGSRIVCVPCNEHTIRGFSGINLLIIDEAARVPEDVYQAVRPMLIASHGRMICLSTPQGKRGFFYKAWTSTDQDWQRIEIPATMCPRLRPEDLEQERRALGDVAFRQEYMCTFEVLKGLIYPDLANCIVTDQSACPGIKRKVGGIDFGYRNPFAAVWGHIDTDNVLWLTNEHYHREQDIDWHAERLPHGSVLFVCDPHGPDQRIMLLKRNVKVMNGKASRRAGISVVQSLIRNGRLKIVEGACPNLIHEAGLYRWADVENEEVSEDRKEEPESENNHALDALRYLAMYVEDHFPRRKNSPPENGGPGEGGQGAPRPQPKKKSIWQQLNEHTGWTYLS